MPRFLSSLSGPGSVSQFLILAFLSEIEMARGVGEVASIGKLVLAGARDVLHPLCEEVVSVLPHFGDGPGRRKPDLASGLHVGQMLEGQGWRPIFLGRVTTRWR